MQLETLITHMQNPTTYNHPTTNITTLQTHISIVFLTGDYAYKIKKPVNFGFLDFSTLEKRKHYCQQELILNQRLCPDLYLSIEPITQQHNTLQINGTGTPIEYTVKMRQFPQNKIMKNLLTSQTISPTTIKNLIHLLIPFYQNNPTTPEISQYGTLEAVKQNIDENFEQTHSKINITIPQDIYTEIKTINQLFFTKNTDLFQERIKHGHIHDCHGDLHSGNIVLDNKIYIFDCIEFNKRFRYCDIASDLAFLAMDLDYLNHPFLSATLIHTYLNEVSDPTFLQILNFYKSYRAYVRGKVTSFTLDDPHITTHNKKTAITTAKKYFQLSHYYARLINLQLTKHTPYLILIGGLTGTGKSTLAQKIAIDHQATLINTDIIRKEHAGIDKYKKHPDAFNTGLYSPDNIDTTYQTVITKAQHHLKNNENVVLDATFVYQKHRTLAENLANTLTIPFITIQCICPPPLVKQRLKLRQQQHSVSDGRWEIYQHQTTTMDPFPTTPNSLEYHTDNQQYTYRMKFFNHLITLLTQKGD